MSFSFSKILDVATIVLDVSFVRNYQKLTKHDGNTFCESVSVQCMWVVLYYFELIRLDDCYCGHELVMCTVSFRKFIVKT